MKQSSLQPCLDRLSERIRIENEPSLPETFSATFLIFWPLSTLRLHLCVQTGSTKTMPAPRAVSVPLPRLLSLLPNDGVGARVYAARWAAKGLPVPTSSAEQQEASSCYWDVKKVRLAVTEAGHVRGRAYGVLNWKGASPSFLSISRTPVRFGLNQLRHDYRQASDRRRIRTDSRRAQVPVAGGAGPSRPRRGGKGDRGTTNSGSGGGGRICIVGSNPPSLLSPLAFRRRMHAHDTRRIVECCIPSHCNPYF